MSYYNNKAYFACYGSTDIIGCYKSWVGNKSHTQVL